MTTFEPLETADGPETATEAPREAQKRPHVLQESTPPAALREALAFERAQGASFADAWPVSVAAVLSLVCHSENQRTEWAGVFEGTRPYFRAAYHYEGERLRLAGLASPE